MVTFFESSASLDLMRADQARGEPYLGFSYPEEI
jgi:hypothetical protein